MISLAWSAMRHRPTLWWLLVLGVALSAFLPVVSSGLKTEATVASVTSAVRALPSSERAVLAVSGRDLRGRELARVDQTVRQSLAAAGLGPTQRGLTFRPLSLGGTDATVGAVDALAADVSLRSGRLPDSCRPTACQVLAVAPPNGQQPLDVAQLTRSARGLGLVVTGTAELTDQRLVGVRLVAADTPLLLGSDPVALAGLGSLSLFGRNTSWVAGLDGATIAASGVPAFTRDVAEVANRVNEFSSPLSVSWPIDAVAAASARADASAERFTLLGAGAGLLQLGFCLVVAAGMRRQQQLGGRLLTRRGAAAGQVALIAVIQPLIAVAVGLLVGACLGAVVVGLRALGLAVAPWRSAREALDATGPTLALLGVAAVVLTAGVARWPARARRSTQLVLDVALLVLAGTTVLLLVGANRGTAGSFAPSVVVMLAVVTGLLAARLWDPVVGLLSGARHGAGASPVAAVRQVALVGGRRRPLLAKVTAGFVAAACCSLVFASVYRGSLVQSAVDQAAAQVPLDVRVAPSTSIAVPLDALDLPRLTAAVPEVGIYPVVSAAVSAFAGSSLATALPLTGVDPDVLTRMHEFGATTGSDLAPAELAARLTTERSAGHHRAVLPAGTTRVSIAATGGSSDITVALWVSTPEGREEHVQLADQGGYLSARLASGPERTVQAVEIAESDAHLTHRQHGVGEGSTDRELVTGTLRLGAVSVEVAAVSEDARPAPWSWSSWGSDQADVTVSSPAVLTARYQLSEVRTVITPGYVPQSALPPLPVAVDPDTAARAGSAGLFGITVNGFTVRARTVAVLPRMPAVGPTFILADRAAVVALLERSAPGTAAVSQVWLSAPGASLPLLERQLETSAAARATLSFRTDLSRSIRDDPVTVRSTALLALTGAVALLLAVVGLVTAVRADLTQTAAESVALELDGWSPRGLRRVHLVRWLSVLVVAVPVGIAGGCVLAATGIRILTTGPSGTEVVPPLRLMLATPGTLVVTVAAALCAVLAAWLAAGTAYRQPALGREDVDS